MIQLKKRFGQHLLIAEPTIEKIVQTLAPTKNDTVLEIGPGTGNLTKHLLKHAGRVIAVERDPEMVETLCRNFKSQISRHGGQADCGDSLQVIQADFLEFDLTQALKHPKTRTLFCGNLPYNISTPILFKLRDHRNLFDRGVITIQREVAERLVAREGSKDYGILSIMMQVAAKMEKCFNISPRSFVPPPKVTSSVVKLTFTDPPPHHIENKELFERIVKATFNTRRKMIRNSIPKEYLPALEKAGIDQTARPEDLPIEVFIKLAAVIPVRRGGGIQRTQ